MAFINSEDDEDSEEGQPAPNYAKNTGTPARDVSRYQVLSMFRS